MKTYRIEYTFVNYVGKVVRAVEEINARSAKTAIQVFKTNYSFDDTICIKAVYVDDVKGWKFICPSQYEKE